MNAIMATRSTESSHGNKRKILVLCAANSARSQMAEGLLRHDFGDRFEANSAGSRATSVRPEAIQVMKEIEIDISRQRSKSIDEFAGESFDYVLTVRDEAKESCPIFPGHGTRFHHSFEDPAAVDGSQEERLAVHRRVRDQIREYLKEERRVNRNEEGPSLRSADVLFVRCLWSRRRSDFGSLQCGFSLARKSGRRCRALQPGTAALRFRSKPIGEASPGRGRQWLFAVDSGEWNRGEQGALP